MSLEEVARQAGVSTATVSRVINNIGVVRDATRSKVLQVMDELKYSPNLHARALAGAGKTIGLIVSNLENPFFLDIFHYLDQRAHELGYEVLIANTAYDPERLRRSIQMMLGRRPTGLGVVVSELDAAVLDDLSRQKIRTVAHDATGLRPGVTNIRTNYGLGMGLISEYLYNLGHRRMAFVGHHSALGPLNDRRRSFEEAMKNFDGVRYLTVANDDSYTGGKMAVREIFQSGLQPTAIVCVNDFMAIGVLRQLHDLGLRVPQDVSVTGFDNISLAEVCLPALTTIHIPRDLIGRQILDCIVSAEAPDEILIEPELLVRESTGAAPPTGQD